MFYVDGHKFSAWDGDDTVEEKFDREGVNSGSSAFSRVVYSIAANGDSCAVRIILFYLVSNNDAAVGDILPEVCGDIILINEENNVGAFNLARYSLGKSSKFFSVGLTVQLVVFRFFSLVGGIPLTSLFLRIRLHLESQLGNASEQYFWMTMVVVQY